jgi:predicted ester cyclase
MSAEKNKEIVHAYADEVWIPANEDAAGRYIDTNFVNHNPSPGEPPGLEGFIQGLRVYRGAFPNAEWKFHDLIAEGDKVAERWSVHGTHDGELFGVSPTGREVTMTGINIFRLKEGKIAERWGELDALGMMLQLGAIQFVQSTGSTTGG